MASKTYRITARGRLTERLASAFEGMTLEPGRGETGLVGPQHSRAVATWLLAVDTPFGPREVDLRLPPDAVLRWPPQAPVIALGEADYARLAALADLLERSYAALDRVHEDPRSGISNLAWRLFRLESASSAGLAGVPRVWAEQRRRLSTQDLVLLEGLAQDLEQAVAMLRRLGRSGASDSARAVIQDESGQLLLEAGWLRDLCRRVSQPGPR